MNDGRLGLQGIFTDSGDITGYMPYPLSVTQIAYR